MRIIHGYILRPILFSTAGILGVTLFVLLLERMLRILDFTLGSNAGLGVASQMLINLVPHYAGVALPAAFFLAILLTFHRLSADGELAALRAVGHGLHRMVVPVIWLAIGFALITALLFAYLQPLGRYTYRAVKHATVHASLAAAVEGGAFVHVDNMTFMAESASLDGSRLRKVFVFEESSNGRSFVTTSAQGLLTQSADDLRTVLALKKGQRVSFASDGGEETVSFDEFAWPLGKIDTESFRNRGGDERELTLFELFQVGVGGADDVNDLEARSEAHGRLVKIATVLILPFLAIPLGLTRARTRSSYGIAVGLIILIVYEKLLQFAESLGNLGGLPPELSLWTLFVAFTVLSLALFRHVAFKIRENPFDTLADRAAEVGDWVVARLMRERSTTS